MPFWNLGQSGAWIRILGFGVGSQKQRWNRGFGFCGLKSGFGTGGVGRLGERLPQNLALKPLGKSAASYIFWQKTSKMRRESENGCGLGKKLAQPLFFNL